MTRVMKQVREKQKTVISVETRIMGVGAIIVGVGAAIWGLAVLLDSNATITVNEVPSSDPWIKTSVVVAGLVAVVFGVLVLKGRFVRSGD